jgi:hypothetical protein
MLPQLGKILILVGGITFLFRVILLFAPKIPYLGRLPGDIVVKKEGYSLYFPMVTFVIVSLPLTLPLNLFSHFFRS